MKLYKSLRLLHTVTPSETLQESIRIAIQTKNYPQIAHLLSSTNPNPNPNPNPFSFLSSFSQSHQTLIVDEILQSFIPIRPRSLSHPTYSLLLSQTLTNPSSLPLSLAIIHRAIRSGFIPAPQTRLSLSAAWLDRRLHNSISEILSEMRAIRYNPDLNTVNYVLSSLCAADEMDEAIRVLKGMGKGGSAPDSESYGVVIGALCRKKRTDEVAKLVREMVGEIGLVPRQGTVVRAVAAMRANREVRRAVDMVGFLEKEGCVVGFQSYAMIAEGCLERGEFVLAGKVVMEMVERGLIPSIGIRLGVVEGLFSVGDREMAVAVRRRLAELAS